MLPISLRFFFRVAAHCSRYLFPVAHGCLRCLWTSRPGRVHAVIILIHGVEWLRTHNEPHRRQIVVSVCVYMITKGTYYLSLQYSSFFYGTTHGFFNQLRNRRNTFTNGVGSVKILSLYLVWSSCKKAFIPSIFFINI